MPDVSATPNRIPRLYKPDGWIRFFLDGCYPEDTGAIRELRAAILSPEYPPDMENHKHWPDVSEWAVRDTVTTAGAPLIGVFRHDAGVSMSCHTLNAPVGYLVLMAGGAEGLELLALFDIRDIKNPLGYGLRMDVPLHGPLFKPPVAAPRPPSFDDVLAADWKVDDGDVLAADGEADVVVLEGVRGRSGDDHEMAAEVAVLGKRALAFVLRLDQAGAVIIGAGHLSEADDIVSEARRLRSKSATG